MNTMDLATARLEAIRLAERIVGPGDHTRVLQVAEEIFAWLTK